MAGDATAAKRQDGYGLSAQNRKNRGRVSPSFGLLRQRTRGEAPARGCCCGGGDQEAQAVRASSARPRRARVTAGYHTPADATRLRPSFISRRRRAAPSRYEGARPARLRRASHAACRDRRAGRAAAGPDAARRHPAGRRRLRAAGARGAARGHVRSEEHTSELQSLTNLVCRLLLEKKKTKDEVHRRRRTT